MIKQFSRRRQIIAGVALFVLAVIYIELAVGLVGTPWAGS